MKALLTTLLVIGGLSTAQANDNEILVKFKSSSAAHSMQLLNQLPAGTEVENLGLGNWVKIEVPQTGMEAIWRPFLWMRCVATPMFSMFSRTTALR